MRPKALCACITAITLALPACGRQTTRPNGTPLPGQGGAGGTNAGASSGGVAGSQDPAGAGPTADNGGASLGDGGQVSQGGAASVGGGGGAAAVGMGGASGVGHGAGAGTSGMPSAGRGGAPTAGSGGMPAAGTSGMNPPGPATFAIDWELASTVKSTAPSTVAIVTWSVNKPILTAAHVEFGPDTGYGVSAPVDLSLADYRTVLVGMKAATKYHFRVVATDGKETYTSDDQELVTGALPAILSDLKLTVTTPSELDQGFIIGSFWQSDDSATAFIIDTDGDLVWWYTDPDVRVGASDGLGRARLSADSHDVWLVDAQRALPMRRVSIDGLDEQTYMGANGSHDIAAVSGGTMAYLDTHAQQCAVITEIDKSGATKLIFDSTAVMGGYCHDNAIRYSQKQDLYVFSNRKNDVYCIDRAGNVKWGLGSKVSGGTASWGGVQHGLQLLPASLLVFANEAGGDQPISQAIEFGLDGSEIRRFMSRGGTDYFGDVQRLPSGNTLINYAGLINVVDPDDNVVLELKSAGSAFSYSEFRTSLYGEPLDITQ